MDHLLNKTENKADLPSVVQAELFRAGVQDGQNILVGVSGGADSIALLHSLYHLYRQGNLSGRLFAAHLDHGIRGEASREEAEFTAALCRDLRIPLIMEHIDVPYLAAQRKKGIEETAREERYAFLRRAKEQAGAAYIAVAHHRNDQAETVLLHLLRGCGLSGLCGMRQHFRDIVRPFLRVDKEQILMYLEERGLSYRTDETNFQQQYFRNRVRLELLPLLREKFNPSVENALCQMAELCAQDEAYLQQRAQEALAELRMPFDGVDRQRLRKLPQALKTRILRTLLQEHGALYDITYDTVMRLCSLLEAETGAKCNIQKDIWAWVSYDSFHIGALHSNEYADWETPLIIPGITKVPGGYYECTYTEQWEVPADKRVAYLNADRLPQELTVRFRRPGDRFRPFRAPGEKKLKDVLIDKKIPRQHRDGPFIYDGEQLVFLTGHTIADPYRITNETTLVLRVMYVEEGKNDGGVV